ncbi:hypothetical protein NZK33_07965 [Cyanobium sp. FGCU-6]|nr:hypothetical protein [Cyanobium sp. FGCU6]
MSLQAISHDSGTTFSQRSMGIAAIEVGDDPPLGMGGALSSLARQAQ